MYCTKRATGVHLTYWAVVNLAWPGTGRRKQWKEQKSQTKPLSEKPFSVNPLRSWVNQWKLVGVLVLHFPSCSRPTQKVLYTFILLFCSRSTVAPAFGDFLLAPLLAVYFICILTHLVFFEMSRDDRLILSCLFFKLLRRSVTCLLILVCRQCIVNTLCRTYIYPPVVFSSTSVLVAHYGQFMIWPFIEWVTFPQLKRTAHPNKIMFFRLIFW